MKRDYKRQNKRNMKKLGIKPVKVKRLNFLSLFLQYFNTIGYCFWLAKYIIKPTTATILITNKAILIAE